MTTYWRSANCQLEQWVATKSIAVVGVVVTIADGKHPEHQHLIKLMDDLSGIAPVAEALRQNRRQSEAALSFPQKHQPSVRRNRSAIKGRRHFFALNGWKIEGKKAIVVHGGCGSVDAAAGNRLDNESLQ